MLQILVPFGGSKIAEELEGGDSYKMSETPIMWTFKGCEQRLEMEKAGSRPGVLFECASESSMVNIIRLSSSLRVSCIAVVNVCMPRSSQW